MSISFNHPNNTMTSTDSLILTVEGGTSLAPRSIRFNANSIIVPPRALPQGESGALVFDTASSTLKYHNGVTWVELLSKEQILSEVNDEINLINTKLDTKIDTVTYSTSSVPAAGISGTTLNIVFPASSGGSTTTNGLFTSTRPGSIMQYSLLSGQSIASIREQMGGSVGSQNGRNGTSSSPYITRDGWCFADGNYWTWIGPNSTVTKQVPNLNQNAYMKGLASGGITKTDAVIGASGTVGNTTITPPLHYHGVGMMDGVSDVYADDGLFIYGKQWNDGKSYNGVAIFGDDQRRYTKSINGSNTNTALTTTDAIYYSGNGSYTHNHSLANVDVAHFNVAMLYNIAEPATALPLDVANTLYVKKAGDSMLGPLNVLTPTANMHATTKLYVDNLITGLGSLYLKKTGDSMSGPLTVLTPTANMHAATKLYVDTAVANASSSKSYASYIGQRDIDSNVEYQMATFNIVSSASVRAARISLPVVRLDEGSLTPTVTCYIVINNVLYLSNRILIGQAAEDPAFTPIVTAQIPAGTTNVNVEIRVVCTESARQITHQAGYVWMDII